MNRKNESNRRIAVFCGSNFGNSNKIISEVKRVAEVLVKNKFNLVYGGSTVGLMGLLADTMLELGGQVYGVIPNFFNELEIAHPNLTEIYFVNTMHERKAKMYQLCDGVIALPGGLGTLDELFEMATWRQLGLHDKPVGLLNLEHYYTHLISLLNTMLETGFINEAKFNIIIKSDNIEDLLIKMFQ
ncbi:MAG: TIGR00730 family Rossman fold protein [Alphaproteobacteria bacterium]|nr:TIGR00730 family Rossman fold protein [Alphaproteobacteria bacterium]